MSNKSYHMMFVFSVSDIPFILLSHLMSKMYITCALAFYKPILTIIEASIVGFVRHFSYQSAKKEENIQHQYQVRVYELTILL